MTPNLKPYPRYKTSGVEWLGQVPEHWEVRRTKSNVTNVIDQTSEREKDDAYIALEHVQSWTGRISDAGSEVEFDSQVKRFRRNDVLFGKLRPYLAKVARPVRDGVCVGEFLVLRADEQTQTSNFLEQLMRSKPVVDVINASTFGAKMPRADWNFIGSLPQALPPLPEQASIVRYLDHVDRRVRRLVRAKRKLIALLSEQKQAIISHAVTKGLDSTAEMKDSGTEYLGEVPEHWSVVALKHLVSRSIIDGPHVSPQKLDEGVPFISAQAIGKGYIDFDKKWGYISPEDHELYSQRYKPERGDILLVKLGATTGVPAIVETDTDFSIWVPLAAIRLSKHIQPRYIFRVLGSDNLRAAYELNWTYGTQQTLGLETISNLRVPLPPEKERQDIVDYVDEVTADIDTTITRAEREIELLNEYRTRLIADVVTGKLDVREAAAALPEVDPLAEDDDADDLDADLTLDADELDEALEEVEA